VVLALVAVVPGGAAVVSFFSSLCRGIVLCFSSSPSASVYSSLFQYLYFVLSLSLFDLLFHSLFFPRYFSLFLFVLFDLSPLFFLFICLCFLSFFQSQTLLPPLSRLSPLVFIKRKRGREDYYPCLVMAQG